jgi:hypothetical protein
LLPSTVMRPESCRPPSINSVDMKCRFEIVTTFGTRVENPFQNSPR